MAAFNDTKFTDALKSSAATVLNVAPAAVPIDFISIIMDLITGIFSGCLNKPDPTPTTPTEAATQLKNATPFQKSLLKQRTRKHFKQAGKGRHEADQAHETMLAAVAATSTEDLAQAIEDAKTDAAVFPDVDLF